MKKFYILLTGALCAFSTHVQAKEEGNSPKEEAVLPEKGGPMTADAPDATAALEKAENKKEKHQKKRKSKKKKCCPCPQDAAPVAPKTE